MRQVVFVLCVSLASRAVAAGESAPRTLTFEDRVRAQEAIERVYYRHQIGATRPFEEAAPRALLERKVRKYLEESAALEYYWKIRVSDQMLHRELDRMSAGTRMSEQLNELFAALDDDAFLIKECLARATLVDRLAHNFYDFDRTLHAEAMLRAEEIHHQLETGALSPWMAHPSRTVWDLLAGDGDTSNPAEERVSPEAYRQRLSELPSQIGRVSPIRETREGFVFDVVLSETASVARVARYVFRKTPWDLWWAGAERAVSAQAVPVVATTGGSIELRRSTSDPPALSPCTPDSWNNGVLDDGPEPRRSHTAVWTGSVMLVWGGGSPDVTSPGMRYDPATDTWSLMSGIGAPAPRQGHVAVWTGSAMVVWGGLLYGGSQPTDTGGLYDPVADTWTPTSRIGAPTPRLGHTAIWTGHRIVVWGGRSYTSPGYLATGALYDPASDSWSGVSTAGAPSPRHSHTAVWTDREMLVWGGWNGSTQLGTGGRYDPVTDTWTTISTVGAPTARYAHTAVWSGKDMLVWGGASSSTLTSGGRYDPSTDTWAPMSTTGAPPSRAEHTAVWTGTEMLVWGGDSNVPPDYVANDGGRYDPGSDSWSLISTSRAPGPRRSHTAVWTGHFMVVWGGTTGTSGLPMLNSGGRYDPTTDSWTPTSTAGSPSSRSRHTAVWTGTAMIVWGGATPIGTNAGGRYDPATDSWAPTSVAGAPSPRGSHTAVWTGESMVVWGGFSYDAARTILGDGGRYDPISDTWLAMTTTGAPGARYGHTAVWTGSEMIVWGGDGNSLLGTGGRYYPATDSWSTVSPVGAPAPRDGFTAVWSGREMIVWGGYNYFSGGYLDSGGRYDPGADQWYPMSTVSAPPPRREHTAVWTGSVMVVWGGFGGPVQTTGGRYDPETDSWTPTSVVGAPSSRRDHTAVWTGGLMLVWGGSADGYSPLADGGRYDPASDLWAPITALGPPTPRLLHSAVWTGYQMIVWGGIANGSFRDSGGRYGPGGWPNDDCDGDGLTAAQGDCDDSNASVHPGAQEACNGTDDDCNGVVDDGGDTLCDDRNLCTSDSCGGTSGCAHTNTDGPCDDGNPCTTGDTCGGGTCHPGGPTDCDDGNCCTVDACDPSVGCYHTGNTTPPVFTTQPSLGDTFLWPPEHGYADFTLGDTGVAASAACGIASIRFASCRSSQPENGTGTGDGNTLRDCVYEPEVLHLRAERDGACSPIGRVYEMTVVAIDACGNSAVSEPFDVGVWHDRGTPPPTGKVVEAAQGSGTKDTRDGANGSYGVDCGVGNASVNGSVPDRSDVDPEMEITQAASIEVDDLRVDKVGAEVQLTWTAPAQSSLVTRYHVYRRDPVTRRWALLADVSRDTTSYRDPLLDEAKAWDYTVAAVVK